MTTLDIILLIPLVYALYSGFKKGILAQLGGIAGVIIGIWLAFRYSGYLGMWMGFDPDIAYYVAFIIIVVAAIILIGIAGWCLGKLFHWVGLGLINRIGGIVLSLAKTVLILGALLMAFTAINRNNQIVSKKQFSESFFYSPIVRLTEYAFPFLEKMFDAIDLTGYNDSHL